MHCTFRQQIPKGKGTIMKTTTTALVATVLFAGVNAFAAASNIDVVTEQTARPVVVIQGKQLPPAAVQPQSPPPQAAGDLVVGQNGETARELAPRLYPVDTAAANLPKKTRGEVRSEFLAAQAAG